MLSGPAAQCKHLECTWGFFSPLSASFIRVLWSLLSRRDYLSQRLSRPVVAMRGKSSRRRQINRVDKSLKKAPARLDHKEAASNLQDLEVCWDGMKAAAAVVESWHKPDTLGWTTMPDTYSLQWGTCLKGIGLTAGKKGGIIDDSDFKSASKKMDYQFNFYPLSLLIEIRIGLVLVNDYTTTSCSLCRAVKTESVSFWIWYRSVARPALLQPSLWVCMAARASKVEPGRRGGGGHLYAWQEWKHTDAI